MKGTSSRFCLNSGNHNHLLKIDGGYELTSVVAHAD
jgi:hypothetical protein